MKKGQDAEQNQKDSWLKDLNKRKQGALRMKEQTDALPAYQRSKKTSTGSSNDQGRKELGVQGAGKSIQARQSLLKAPRNGSLNSQLNNDAEGGCDTDQESTSKRGSQA